MSKRIVAFVLTLIMIAAFMPSEASAASKTVPMTAYDQVIKSGKTVYCAGAEGIYKVKVNSKGAVKSVKLLYEDETLGQNSFCIHMKKKGDYIYCRNTTTGSFEGLIRINIKTGKSKTLVWIDNYEYEHGPVSYVIKDKKIYYKCKNDKKKMVMKLNGKGKKKTSVTPNMKTKKSNAKGYSVIIKEKTLEDYSTRMTTYLKTPAGKYKLGSHIY